MIIDFNNHFVIKSNFNYYIGHKCICYKYHNYHYYDYYTFYYKYTKIYLYFSLNICEINLFDHGVKIQLPYKLDLKKYSDLYGFLEKSPDILSVDKESIL